MSSRAGSERHSTTGPNLIKGESHAYHQAKPHGSARTRRRRDLRPRSLFQRLQLRQRFLDGAELRSHRVDGCRPRSGPRRLGLRRLR
ncbi:hypothetical protein PLANTIT3_60137 [Plantibacter sp. T3]|nr:hypothetical protein PLANTIT3_60137 [Plantibacter sp. T3]